MKHFAVLLFTAILFCACSKDEPHAPSRPAVRPGEPELPEYPDVSFAAENISEINVGDEDGTLHIILYREAVGSTPPQSCRLTMTEGADFASVGSQAGFTEGSAVASVDLRYSPSKMGARQRRVSLKMAESNKSLNITFIKDDTRWTSEGLMLMFDDVGFKRTTAKYRVQGDKAEWLLSCGDIERHFTVKGNRPEVIADAGVMPASAYGKAAQWPGARVESYFSDDFIALNVCSINNGTAEFPHTEYFFRHSGEYAVATICDGWLLPVIAIDAKLLEPEENKWTTPARIEPDGNMTVFGPYHNGSPLHGVNSCELSSVWQITLNGDKAEVEPQFSGFRNKDVFNFDFMIAAEGFCENGFSKIVFEKPRHNCNADGLKNSAVICLWAKTQPTIIEIRSAVEH